MEASSDSQVSIQANGPVEVSLKEHLLVKVLTLLGVFLFVLLLKKSIFKHALV